ncbi:integrase catalytic domain-containing protein [Trichonephila clavipes]|nr:integrase catalytic domain-containing protein [Trichonephila clavipes]
MFDSSKPDDDVVNFVSKLKSHMQSLHPKPPKHHGKRPVFIHPGLLEVTHVFLRRDMLRRPLQQPYDGPFKVLQRKDKVFFLDINGKRVSASIDRCKPAFFLSTEDLKLPQTKNETPATVEPNPTPATVESDPTASTPTQPSTRSGRKVHLPTRCKRFSAQKTEVVPSSLPKDRISNSKIFQVVGVDLAGPLHLKDRRKSWVVLFTCAVFRAVHFELITSLSTAAFLQSLRRFISRRGRPTIIYSDNGTNFVGSNSALNSIDWDVVISKANIQKIKCKFNPPSAAWWGGFWERRIQMLKQILRKMLGRASLYYEELNTVLCECEHVINSRPLTYISEDVNDLSPLTPAMFLQEIEMSNLRKRFRIEYLGQLREQTQHHRKLRPLTVGEVVVVENSLKNRTLWSLARVIQLIPGKYGHVRVARVKTETGELVIPVQRLYNLELQEPETKLPKDLTDSVIRTRRGRKVISPKRLTYA